jgi:hypothetical protein
MGCAVLGVVAAAAAPAATTIRAKMRMASFIEGNLWWIRIGRKHISCTPKS